jgi:hypothetical protein
MSEKKPFGSKINKNIGLSIRSGGSPANKSAELAEVVS